MLAIIVDFTAIMVVLSVVVVLSITMGLMVFGEMVLDKMIGFLMGEMGIMVLMVMLIETMGLVAGTIPMDPRMAFMVVLI